MQPDRRAGSPGPGPDAAVEPVDARPVAALELTSLLCGLFGITVAVVRGGLVAAAVAACGVVAVNLIAAARRRMPARGGLRAAAADQFAWALTALQLVRLGGGATAVVLFVAASALEAAAFVAGRRLRRTPR